MAGELSVKNLCTCVLVVALLSQTAVTPVMCRKSRGGVKKRLTTDSHRPSGSSKDYANLCRRSACQTPSTPSHHGGGHGRPAPSHGGGGSYGTPTPSHGGGYYSPPSGVTPPSPVVDPGTPTPSHGSGNCSPPSSVTPPSPVVDPGTPTPSHGSGGGYYSPPSGVTPPPLVDPGMPTPSHGGGGGGYYSPPSGVTPPSPVVDPGTPTPYPGSGGGYYSPPSGVTPPTPVVDPGTPTPSPGSGGSYYSPPSGVTPPSPVVSPTPTLPPFPPTPSTPPSPLVPDPNLPIFFPGTCNYWSTHPEMIWGIFGDWGKLGKLLGVAWTPVADLGLLEALRNTRGDGMGALYREGTAAFLNSMVTRGFPFSTEQVREAFAAGLASQQAAANQARVFQFANEGRLRH